MDYTYCVYVIELNGLVNAVYVGQTSLRPEERLAQHLAGYKHSRVVRRQGGHLRPDLYGHLPRVHDREQALALEAATAQALRSQGWTVYGGH